MRTVSLLVLLATTAHAEPLLPPGGDVSPAIYVDITEAGFGQIENLLRAVLPETVPIDNAGLVQGGSFGSSFLGADYNFGVENLKVKPEIDSILVDPQDPGYCRPIDPTTPLANGKLAIDANLLVSLNDFQDPAYAYLDASISVLFFDLDILSEECNIVIYRKPVSASIDVEVGRMQNPITCQFEQIAVPDCPLDLVLRDPKRPPNPSSNPEICPCTVPHVEIENFEWYFGIQNIDDLDLDCSGFISLIIDIADFFGIDPVEILLESLKPTIDGTINDAIADLEPQIKDALDALTITESLDLLGTPIEANLCPTDVFVDHRGLRVQLDGGIQAPELPHPCVAAYDPGGSRVTVPIDDPRFPDLGNTGVAFDEQIDGLLNDDLLNQALYGVWRGGLLCQRITAEDAGLDLPIAVDSSLLDLIGGGQFAEFFPTPAPLIMATRPEKPPIVRTLTDNSGLALVEVEKLGVDLYAELDGRMTRFVAIDLSAQAGLDAAFNGATGNLALSVDFNPDDIVPVVVYNELKPAASAQVEIGFSSIVDTVAGPLLNDLLGGLSFDLPSFEGLGVQAAVLEPAGPMGDFVGIFGNIGPVGYGGASLGGCDLFGGGGTGGGCDTGCSTGAVPVRITWLFVPMLLGAGLRRRQR